jgi:hypothetical protein
MEQLSNRMSHTHRQGLIFFTRKTVIVASFEQLSSSDKFYVVQRNQKMLSKSSQKPVENGFHYNFRTGCRTCTVIGLFSQARLGSLKTP